MDPPVSDPDKINNQKEAGPSFHCPLYDTQLVHKISLTFLPGLATACVDNTTGDIFKTPGSVAADVKQEMIEYLNHRSETFVADHILLSSSSEIEPSSHDPYDVVSDFVDDFATSKRNLFSRVSGWLLSERREDNIDDFAQEMEVSGFWLNDHIEGIAQTLLKNVDFKGLSHCEMKFQTQGELEAEDALSEVMIPGGGRRRRRSGSRRSGRGRLRLSGRFILRSRHLQHKRNRRKGRPFF